MSYLYIDESGDLGFSSKGSEYFIITCVKIDDERENLNFQRLVKKVRLRKLSKKYKEMPELKFTNSRHEIRDAFLSRIAKLKLEIYSIIIKKSRTKKELQGNLPILYNYLIKILLERPLAKLRNNMHLMICLDRAMSLSQRENFESYIKTEFLSIFNRLPNVKIVHENSKENPALQALDFICGAFGYKYNTAKLKDDAELYTNIIKSRIVIERDNLFKSEATNG